MLAALAVLPIASLSALSAPAPPAPAPATRPAPHGTVGFPPPKMPPPGRGAGPGGRPGGPATPGPVIGPTPRTKGPPATPSGPGGASPGIPGAATPGAQPATDPVSWEHWWSHNGAGWTNLRARVHAVGITTGSDEWFLGRGERVDRGSLAPTAEQIDGSVVPALERALREETSDHVITAALVALAKIGRHDARFAGFLEHRSQEVSETATLAIGLAADPAGVELLRELLLDTERGRAAVRRGEVPYRTRAFAAYGLGLIGARTEERRVRLQVLATLTQVLEREPDATPDVHVAAVTAFGLVRPGATAREDDGADAARRAQQRARREQVRYLLHLFEPARAGDQHPALRAHLATALGRLAAGGDEALAAPVVTALLAAVDERSGEHVDVQAAAVLALGRLGDADDSDADAAVRATLERLVDDGRVPLRRFALIALGQVGARPGTGEAPEAGRDACSALLLRTLTRGRNVLQPWAALALGVHAAERRARGLPVERSLLSGLRHAASGCRRAEDIGAYALALGLAGDAQGEDVLLDRLRDFSEAGAKGYLMLGVGLLGEASSVELVREVLDSATYRPDVLRRAASGLALLGDKDVVLTLLEKLQTARSQASQASLASALGFCGDVRAVEPLVAMLADEDLTDSARAFAAVALGQVCSKDALPWNYPLSEGVNYLALTQTLSDGSSGVLDIL